MAGVVVFAERLELEQDDELVRVLCGSVLSLYTRGRTAGAGGYAITPVAWGDVRRAVQENRGSALTSTPFETCKVYASFSLDIQI